MKERLHPEFTETIQVAATTSVTLSLKLENGQYCLLYLYLFLHGWIAEGDKHQHFDDSLFKISTVHAVNKNVTSFITYFLYHFKKYTEVDHSNYTPSKYLYVWSAH